MRRKLALTKVSVKFRKKELKTAQSGFLAKIFQPGKYKKEEAEKIEDAYEAGSKETIGDFREDCVCNWTKLFASKGVDYSEAAIGNFCAFVDHMSCSAETYVSLGGSNGCADQLTNWDGTQKQGLGAPAKKKGLSL